MCHVEIFQEWQSSLHAQAWSNEVFQASYAKEPERSCRHCHAPQGSPAMWNNEPDEQARNEGIGCASCHVRNGQILGTHASESGLVAHPINTSTDLGSSQFCAGCHQFDYPREIDQAGSRLGSRMHFFQATDGQQRPLQNEMMQDTFGEWQRSHFAREGVECQSCHMERTETQGIRPHVDHRFLGSRDADFLRSAVRMNASIEDEGDGSLNLRVVLRPERVGHAFPTGDLFRRVEVRMHLGSDAPTRVLELARHFRMQAATRSDGRSVLLRSNGSDDRLREPVGDATDERILVRNLSVAERRRLMRGERLHVQLVSMLASTPDAHASLTAQANERVLYDFELSLSTNEIENHRAPL